MTPRQKEIYDLYQQYQNFSEVARLLNIDKTVARRTYRRAEPYLDTDSGIKSAMTDTGLSDINKVHSGWLKTDEASLYFVNPKEEGGVDNLIDTFKEALKDCPTSLPTAAPEGTNADLLTRYILTDLHFGMRAWGKESGEDYDLEIAANRLKETLSTLVETTPDSKQCVVLNLGDMFHSNDHKNMTPGSGHILDADGRFSKVIYETIQSVVATIETLKSKHESIEYVGISGNHDPDSNQFLTVALMMRYQDDPRVDVIWNPAKMWCTTFGKNLLAAHHGDKVTPQRLAMQVADEFSPGWGKTYWRYLDTGHIHHDSAKDIGGIFWESHRTLASRDAYATGSAFTSRKTLKAITVHRERGEIVRNTVGVQ
jgi:hypothetical protein